MVTVGSWVATTGTAALMVVLSALGIYATLILLTRLVGLRSFSKISSFDFAITVAMGSLIATVIVAEDPPLLQGVIGLATLFLIQTVVAMLRNRSGVMERMVNNRPLLLMAGEEVLYENLERAHVTEKDLRAKLRAADVIHPSQVQAVVMETTGDISVLHANPEGPDLDPDLFTDVRDAERLFETPRGHETDGPRAGQP